MKRIAIGISAVCVGLLTAGLAAAQNAPALRLYADPGFSGDSRRVDRGIENLDAMSFADKARSMIAEGRWEVCLDARYRGGCRVVQGRVSDMGDWNARVSSVRYLGPSDWGANGEAGASADAISTGGSAAITTAGASSSQSGSSSGPVYRLDYRPEVIGNIYDTGFGRMTIERWDTAGVSGPYAGTADDRSDAGRIEGTVTPDPSDGGTNLAGYWYAQTSGQRCATQRGGTYHWGSMTLIFNRAHDNFQGYWAYCDSDGAPEGSWHGDLVGRDPTIAAAIDAQLASGQSGPVTGSSSAGLGRPVSGQGQAVPVDSQGRPLPGFIDRTARAAGDEAERRVQDRIRDGIGRIF